MLRGLVVVAGLGLAVGVVAELMAPGVVEAGIEDTVRARTGEQAQVEAEASGSPFLPGLLLDGRIEQVEITLRELAGHGLAIGTASIRVESIHLDRAAMYRGDVRITDVDRGEVVIVVDEREIADTLGSPVELDPELVELVGTALEVAGTTVLDLPVDRDLMPCEPDLEVDPPHVRLSCAFEGIPGVLRTAGEA